MQLNRTLTVSCTKQFTGTKGKWGRAWFANLTWKSETRASVAAINLPHQGISQPFCSYPKNQLGNVKNIRSCCRKGWKEGVIWVSNSTGENGAEGRAKVFDKVFWQKVFCDANTPFSSSWRGKGIGDETSNHSWAISQGFHSVSWFLAGISSNSIEICFSPNAVKTE